MAAYVVADLYKFPVLRNLRWLILMALDSDRVFANVVDQSH